MRLPHTPLLRHSIPPSLCVPFPGAPAHCSHLDAINVGTRRRVDGCNCETASRKRACKLTMDNGVAERYASSRVYCNDQILTTLQCAPWRTHLDSKTLVDRPLKVHPDVVVSAFAKLGDHPPEVLGMKFVKDFFHDSPNDDTSIISHVPHDFVDGAPPQLQMSASRVFAADLKSRWLQLCRRFRSTESEPRSSLIPLPHPFFVPGGRFRECYYWDTLWIVHGLIASDMLQSAVGVVRNLLHLVETLGFVPNGNRVYYLNRSQPPVLPEAVNAVLNALETRRQKIEWLNEALPILEKEYDSFIECRQVQIAAGLTLPLSSFNVKTSKPRPESYSEDIKTASEAVLKRTNSSSSLSAEEYEDVKPIILSMNQKSLSQVYQDIASGAESGWDFSSRWVRHAHKGLTSIRTSKIVPACLNSVMLRDEKLLAEFHTQLAAACDVDQIDERDAHLMRAQSYREAAQKRTMSMNQLMWSSEQNMWMDYDIGYGEQSRTVSVAGLMPLWACAWEGTNWTTQDAASFVKSLMNDSGLVVDGGLACTNVSTEEQWDFPNMWTPLVDIAVTGLRNLEEAFPGCGAADAAREIAMRTLRSIHAGWQRDGVMHEKYDAVSIDGRRGERGEYEPQEGFGWTNGVALKLMSEYREAIDKAAPGTWLS